MDGRGEARQFYDDFGSVNSQTPEIEELALYTASNLAWTAR